MSSKFKFDLYPYKCRLKHGNYRIYDQSGNEIWKSLGKSDFDKTSAIDMVKDLSKKFNNPTPKAEPIKQNNLVQSQEKLQDSLNNQKNITNKEKDKKQNLLDFLNAGRAKAYKTGKPFEDIVKEWALNPNTLPENLRGKLDDETFNQLMLFSKGPTNLTSIIDSIEEKQKQRRAALNPLYEGEEDRQQALSDELKMMTDPNIGTDTYKTLWDAMTEEQRESINPEQMRRIGLEKDLDRYKGEGFQQGQQLSGLMPKEDFKLNWGSEPSYAAAKSIWDSEYSPNYRYGSDKPFDQKEHQLAASGHGPGSSSLDMNQTNKGMARNREELENIRMIQQMLETEHRSRGDTIGQLDRLAKGSRSAFGEPIEKSSNLVGEDIRRGHDQSFKDKVFQKDLTEGEMNLATSEMGEDQNSYMLSEQQRGQELQQYQGLANQVYQFGMLAEQIGQMGAEKEQEFAMLKESIWQSRAQIVAMFRKLNMQEEAFELQKAEASKESFMQKLALIAKIGGTAALAAMGQPVAAVGLWAPNAASMFQKGGSSQGGSWMGTGAQTGGGNA